MGEMNGEQMEDALGLMMDYVEARNDEREGAVRKEIAGNRLRQMMVDVHNMKLVVSEYEAEMVVSERETISIVKARDLLGFAELAAITNRTTVKRLMVNRKPPEL